VMWTRHLLVPYPSCSHDLHTTDSGERHTAWSFTDFNGQSDIRGIGSDCVSEFSLWKGCYTGYTIRHLRAVSRWPGKTVIGGMINYGLPFAWSTA